MAKESSVAPKERINIVFKPSTGDMQEEKELPLRLLMVGDFSLSESDEVVEDRSVVNIDKHSFDAVLASKNIELDMVVKNTLDTDVEELPVSLKVGRLADFSPDAVAAQVPELRNLLEIRQALTALKGPLGNVPAFRKHIQKILESQQDRDALLAELGIQEGETVANADS